MRTMNCFFWGRLLLAIFVIGLGSAYAGTAGSLDPTFGVGGVTTTTITGANGIVNSMLLQSDGKILVLVGGAEVLRYTTTGALDANFGNKGVVVLATPIGGSLALQSNGQIVVGGVVTPSTGGAALGAERLNVDGSEDISFGSAGVAMINLNRTPLTGSAVLVQPNGDILVGTQLDPVGRRQPVQTALARFNSSGAPDSSFGNQGLSITNASGCTALALLASGDILTVDAQAVAQITPSGSLEATVSGGLVVATSQSSSAFVPSIFQSNGDYLFGTEVFTGEESRGHNAAAQVLRLTETGRPDPNFSTMTFHYVGSGGSGIEALVQGVAVAANGDIVVVGDQITFLSTGNIIVNGLARLTPTGNLDSTFGNGGIVVNTIPSSSAVVVQLDGNIVTAGFGANNNGLTLARYVGE